MKQTTRKLTKVSPKNNMPVHTTHKTKSHILIEIFIKCFLNLEMEDKINVATRTVAACQNDLDLPIAKVNKKAGRNQ